MARPRLRVIDLHRYPRKRRTIATLSKVTLRDVQFPPNHSHPGPWQAGSEYFGVFRLINEPTKYVMMRSQGDPTDQTTWRQASVAVSTGFVVLNIWTFQTADGKIHVSTHHSGGVGYSRFDPSTGAWDVADGSVDGVALTSTDSGVSIVGVSNIDGDLLIAYAEQNTNRDRVMLTHFSGGWGGSQSFFTIHDEGSAASNSIPGALVINPSDDRTHVFYTATGVSDLGHRSLSNAGALGTDQDIDTDVVAGKGAVANAVIFDGGGTLRLRVLYADADGTLSFASGDAAAAPTWASETGISDTTVLQANSEPAATLAKRYQHTALEAVWVQGPDTDIWSDTRPYGGTFGKETERQDAVTALRVAANSYPRDSIDRLAYFWDNYVGGVGPSIIVYSEYELYKSPILQREHRMRKGGLRQGALRGERRKVMMA